VTVSTPIVEVNMEDWCRGGQRVLACVGVLYEEDLCSRMNLGEGEGPNDGACTSGDSMTYTDDASRFIVQVQIIWDSRSLVSSSLIPLTSALIIHSQRIRCGGPPHTRGAAKIGAPSS